MTPESPSAHCSCCPSLRHLIQDLRPLARAPSSHDCRSSLLLNGCRSSLVAHPARSRRERPFSLNLFSCSGLSSRCISPSRFRECCSSVVPRGVSGERLIRAGRRILWQNIVSRGTDEFHRSHNRIMCSHRILLPSYHHLATHRPHSIILLAILMNNSSIFMG